MTEVRLAVLTDVPKIAEIHMRTLPKSINSAMGIPRLVAVYEQTLRQESVTMLVATEGAVIQGFICGCSNYEDLSNSARGTYSLRQAVQACRALGFVEFSLQAIGLLSYLSKLKALGNFYYLANWAMLPNSPPALGALIFRAIWRQALLEGSKRIVVTVGKKERALLNFYYKLEFRKVTSTRSMLFLIKPFE